MVGWAKGTCCEHCWAAAGKRLPKQEESSRDASFRDNHLQKGMSHKVTIYTHIQVVLIDGFPWFYIFLFVFLVQAGYKFQKDSVPFASKATTKPSQPDRFQGCSSMIVRQKSPCYGTSRCGLIWFFIWHKAAKVCSKYLKTLKIFKSKSLNMLELSRNGWYHGWSPPERASVWWCLIYPRVRRLECEGTTNSFQIWK